MTKRFIALLCAFMLLFVGTLSDVSAVTTASKLYTYTNGNANDASQVDAEFVNLYNNDATLTTAVTNLQSNTMTIDGGKTFSSNIKDNGIDPQTAGSGVLVDQMLIKSGKPNIQSEVATVSSVDTAGDTITTNAAHGISTGDIVQIRTIGGTIPAGTSATAIYYANANSTTVISLHTNPANATAGTPKVDLTSAGSGTIQIVAKPATPAEGDIWANGGVYTSIGGSNLTIANGNGVAWPYDKHGNYPPVYASSSTFTMAKILERDSTDAVNIKKTTSTTVDVTTFGINGIAQSAALTGTLDYTNSSTTVTGHSTTFSTDIQAGDTLYDSTNSVVIGVVATVGSNTSITLAANFSGTSKTGVSYKRGAKAANSVWFLYAITDGVTPGLIVSNRNVAKGDTLPSGDLPSGYTYSRQLPFAATLDGSANIIPFTISTGWPTRPVVLYNTAVTFWNGSSFTAGTFNPLNAGTATSWATLTLSGTGVPSISKEAWILVQSSSSSNYQSFRANGDSIHGPQVVGVFGMIPIKTNSSQQIQYQRDAGAGSIYIDVYGFTVTEVP